MHSADNQMITIQPVPESLQQAFSMPENQVAVAVSSLEYMLLSWDQFVNELEFE